MVLGFPFWRFSLFVLGSPSNPKNLNLEPANQNDGTENREPEPRTSNLERRTPLRYGCTVSVALFVTACAVAVTETAVVAVTRLVRTPKVPATAPCGNTIEVTVGVAIVAFRLASATVNPPAGAAHSLVTVPPAVVPPDTADGVNDTALT